MNDLYLRRFPNSAERVDFGRDFGQVLPEGAIGNDEPLVREYLLHFFAQEATWEPFAVYLRESYLKPLFAEAKLAAGVGSPDQWSPLMSPAALQALKERVDLEWSATNAENGSGHAS